mgnify:CR=1 FL=1
MISAISVKDRLKNLKDEGISMQYALVSYGLERTIYVSQFHLMLKDLH